MNEFAGPYAGLDRFAARKKIVADLEAGGLLEKIEDYKHAVSRLLPLRHGGGELPVPAMVREDEAHGGKGPGCP